MLEAVTAEDVRELHLRTAAKATRTEQYDGREHLVVPVIALMEGVIHAVNASEPEYVPSRALAASVSSWNGRPVVLGHPTKNGRQISANDPKTLEAHRFGTIFNAKMDGSRLCMEAWIDPIRLEALDADLLARVKAEKTIEVSVGAHVRTELKAGAHAGKAFKTAWRELSSDHLAFLPKTRGACSIEMGCGALRAAEGTYVTYEVAEGGLLALSGDESLDQRMRLVTEALRTGLAKDGMSTSNAWPRDIFEDYIVYDLDGKLFSVNYEINDDVVEFTSVPMPVKVLPPQYVAAETAEDVLQAFEALRVLVGKRHSFSDQRMLQQVHDNAVSLGADCAEMKAASAWFAHPTAVKALGSISKSDCPHCDGMGQVDKKDCASCDGSGKAKMKMKAASSASSSWLTSLVNWFKPAKPITWFKDPGAVKTLNPRPQSSSWFTPGVSNFSFSAAAHDSVEDGEAALTAKEG